jgi:hypothetical protein
MKEKDITAGELKLFNETIIDYIISLTHLYGLVHKDKVVEIFNPQNKEKINVEAINGIMNNPPKDLANNFVEINGDYFVHETILEFDGFDEQLKHRKGKPFYIPAQEELLKYKEETYFEVTKQYRALLSYVTRHIFDGDEFAAEMLCEDIQGICQFDFSVQEIFEVFNTRGVDFKSEKQVNEVMQLVMELPNLPWNVGIALPRSWLAARKTKPGNAVSSKSSRLSRELSRPRAILRLVQEGSQ